MVKGFFVFVALTINLPEYMMNEILYCEDVDHRMRFANDEF